MPAKRLVTFRLPLETLLVLNLVARKTRTSRTQLLRRATESYLKAVLPPLHERMKSFDERRQEEAARAAQAACNQPQDSV